MATTNHRAFNQSAAVEENYVSAASKFLCTENVLMTGALFLTWPAMGYRTPDFRTYSLCALAGLCVVCATYLKAQRMRQPAEDAPTE
jgi:hypothetical protein